MKRTLLALAGAAAMAAPVAADGAPLPARVNGRAFAALCNADQSACIGYVVGAVDAFVATQMIRGNPVNFCIPGGVTNQQLAETSLVALRGHPELGEDNAATIVIVALTAAYRCAPAPAPQPPRQPPPRQQPQPRR